MSSPSLEDLQQQAQATYVYWPLWLLLKQKRIQKLLSETGIDMHPEIQRLRLFKLPLPDPVPIAILPEADVTDSSTLEFDINVRENIVFFLVKRDDTHQLRLLQMAISDRWYLDHACTQFREMTTHHTPTNIMQSALRWVSCHHSLPEQLNWHPIDISQESSDGGWE